jgi:hypothetical protein
MRWIPTSTNPAALSLKIRLVRVVHARGLDGADANTAVLTRP